MPHRPACVRSPLPRSRTWPPRTSSRTRNEEPTASTLLLSSLSRLGGLSRLSRLGGLNRMGSLSSLNRLRSLSRLGSRSPVRRPVTPRRSHHAPGVVPRVRRRLRDHARCAPRMTPLQRWMRMTPGAEEASPLSLCPSLRPARAPCRPLFRPTRTPSPRHADDTPSASRDALDSGPSRVPRTPPSSTVGDSSTTVIHSRFRGLPARLRGSSPVRPLRSTCRSHGNVDNTPVIQYILCSRL